MLAHNIFWSLNVLVSWTRIFPISWDISLANNFRRLNKPINNQNSEVLYGSAARNFGKEVWQVVLLPIFEFYFSVDDLKREIGDNEWNEFFLA